MINKKLIIIGGVVCTVVAIIVVMVLSNNRSNLTDDQIKEKFSCSRATLDARSTDVYCSNPALYREHLKHNTVIQ